MCVFLNDEICYGFLIIKLLKDGDIVIIDMVVNLNGGLVDFVWIYIVGEILDEV